MLPKNWTGMIGCLSDKGERNGKAEELLTRVQGHGGVGGLSQRETVAELSSEFGIHQNLVNKWKAQLKESASGIFAGDIGREDAKREKELHNLHAKIG